MNTPNNMDQFIQQLKQMPVLFSKYCDNCGHKHDQADFSLVAHQDGLYLFQTTCKNCGQVYLIRLNPSTPAMAVQKMENFKNSDIAPAEFRKFAGKSQVEKEEAIIAFNKLQNVDNVDDFLKLFEIQAEELDQD